jgi:hypothetical protein
MHISTEYLHLHLKPPFSTRKDLTKLIKINTNCNKRRHAVRDNSYFATFPAPSSYPVASCRVPSLTKLPKIKKHIQTKTRHTTIVSVRKTVAEDINKNFYNNPSMCVCVYRERERERARIRIRGREMKTREKDV